MIDLRLWSQKLFFMRYIRLTFFLLLLFISCKETKNTDNTLDITAIPESVTNYAKFTARVHKDQKLKERLAVINKAEPVKILKTLQVQLSNDKEGENSLVAKVELADGKIGYIKRNWLGGEPYVLLQAVRVFDKPDYASTIRATLEIGHIVFAEEENAAGNWLKIWAGKVNGVWLSSHWIEKNSALSSNKQWIIDARDLHDATNLIEQGKIEAATKKLKNISDFSDSDFAKIAEQKIIELEQLNNEQPLSE